MSKETGTDHVMPEDKWAFDDEVTDVFDDMLARSIPQYDVMRELTFQLAAHFQQDKTDILDMGCSRGEAVAALIDKFGASNRFTGIDVSEPMLKAATDRFQGYINCGVVDIRHCDLRTDFPNVSASVVLCVLTLQFTPIEYRLRIIQDIYDHLVPGGALLLVEKVLGASARIDTLMVDEYLLMKSTQGYSRDEIDRKRLSLEGVLVPVTARMNEEFLQSAGFREIDCYWRWLNFMGWLAVR